MNKIKVRFHVTLLLLSIFIGIAACKGDDDNPSPNPNPNTGEPTATVKTANDWIDSIMREDYLWYSEIPARDKLNYTADPKTFFTSFLSNNDGNEYPDGAHYYYSYIESTTSTKSISKIDYSYGLEFMLYRLSQKSYAANILYVADNSPASEAKLKRGDFIITMNGDSITSSNYTLLYGSTAMSLETAKYEDKLMMQPGKVELGAARSIEDDPVYLDSVYTRPGKKIGYLVYNHFTAGKTDNDTKYNEELLSLSQKFKTAGVNEFILDLRYNNGGLISCAELLSAILAPKDVFGSTFCTLEYNDKQNPQTNRVSFNSKWISGGSNLNLSTLYVLVTEETASASELVVNCLKPYMNVITIGKNTEGKNVGSVSYTDNRFTWHLQPIICKIYNGKNQSDYGKIGFTPDYEYDESEPANLNNFLAFGDTDESLLNIALSIIDGTYSTKAGTRSSNSSLKKVASSLDRKASSGVIIDQK